MKTCRSEHIAAIASSSPSPDSTIPSHAAESESTANVYTAARAVFDTPELLEMILRYIHFDMKTLLLAQRVSRSFHNTINRSVHLRRALWWEPNPAYQRRGMLRSRYWQNPLLIKLRVRLRLHAFFLWQACAQDVAPIVDVHFRSLQHARGLPSGSWEKMIVVQPHNDSLRWNLGYENERIVMRSCVAYDQVRRNFSLELTGPPPTLGELRNEVVEKYRPDTEVEVTFTAEGGVGRRTLPRRGPPRTANKSGDAAVAERLDKDQC